MKLISILKEICESITVSNPAPSMKKRQEFIDFADENDVVFKNRDEFDKAFKEWVKDTLVDDDLDMDEYLKGNKKGVLINNPNFKLTPEQEKAIKEKGDVFEMLPDPSAPRKQLYIGNKQEMDKLKSFFMSFKPSKANYIKYHTMVGKFLGCPDIDIKKHLKNICLSN